MKKNTFILIFFICMSLTAKSQTYETEKRPTGFASVPGEGVDEVNGGEGGRVVYIKTIAELETELGKLRTDKPKNLPAAPTIFVFSGNYTYKSKMLYVKYIENATFVGDGTAEFESFGLLIQFAKNIIVRNIKFDGKQSTTSSKISDDGICIEENSHHIWVDHCSFTDYYDGSLDTKLQSRNVTVSWCHFFKHSKNCLVGHADSESKDVIMTMTFHHNFFEGTDQRNPRVRFGKCHIYNNYYANNSLYAVVSACNAKVFMESNYLENVNYPSYCGYMDSPVGDLEERNNVSINCGKFQTHGTTFEPADFYDYTPDDPNGLKEYVPAYAGSGKIDFSYMWNGTTNIRPIPDTNETIINVVYYTINGICISQPTVPGIYVKKIIYEGGRIETYKIKNYE